MRMNRMHEMRFPGDEAQQQQQQVVVGPEAAKTISLESRIRAATKEEKESVMLDQPRGLRVREAVADAIIQILTALKTESSGQDGIPVKDLKSLLKEETASPDDELICPLTLLSFARVCVEQGALAVVHQ